MYIIVLLSSLSDIYYIWLSDVHTFVYNTYLHMYKVYPIWVSNRNSHTVFPISLRNTLLTITILIPIYIIHGYESNDNRFLKTPNFMVRNSFARNLYGEENPKATSFPLIIIWKNYDDGNSLCWNELCVLGIFGIGPFFGIIRWEGKKSQ